MRKYLLELFSLWRIVLFGFTFIAGFLLPFSPRFPYSDIYFQKSNIPYWIWSFANFDGVHYLTIAKSGYSAQFTQVFFPLYPLSLYLFSKLFPWVNMIILGIFISNIFFILLLTVFWRLLEIDYRVDQIKWIIIFLLVFPTSFFFGSLYTESFFLFLIICSFLFARKHKWWLAGMLGALATATRLVGIFLLPSLIYEWLLFSEKRKTSEIKNIFYRKLNSIYNAKFLLLIPLGLLFYMFFLQIKFHDWLLFWHVQPVFGASRSGNSMILFPQVLWRYFKIMLNVPVSQEMFWISLSEVLFTLLSISCLIYAHFKKVRFSYLIFSWCAVIIPTLTGTFSSMPRYILVAFPMYIALGLMRNTKLKAVLILIFVLLLTIYTILFSRGHWVS